MTICFIFYKYFFKIMLYIPYPACFHGPITCMENSETQLGNNLKQYELKRTDQNLIGRARLEPGSLAWHIPGENSLTHCFMEKMCALTVYIFNCKHTVL